MEKDDSHNTPESNVFRGKKESYFGVGEFVLEIIKILFLAFVIITPIRVFLFQPFFVQGASMEPNFEDGQYLVINELGYKKTYIVEPFKELERGAVVVFRYPKDPRQYFIKRVIGLPGEKVKISDGSVFIFNKENPNGFILNESGYLSKDLKTPGDLTVELNVNEYFVMGDNRVHSKDSRIWGPVDKKFIIGRVLIRAWPFNKAKIY